MKQVYSLLITVVISFTSLAQNAKDALQKQLHYHHLVGKQNANGKFNIKIWQWISDHPLPGIYDRGIEDLPRTGALLEGMYFIGSNNPGRQYFYHFISVFNEQKNKEQYTPKITLKIKDMKNIFQFSVMSIVLLANNFLIFALCYYVELMSKLIFEWILAGRTMI